MDTQQLAAILEDTSAASGWLRSLRITQTERGYRNLVRMQRAGLSSDLLQVLFDRLGQTLPTLGDPDLALATLASYLEASLSPLSAGALLERDPEGLRILLRMFAASPMLGRILVEDPAAFELVRLTEGRALERDRLVEELRAEAIKQPSRRSVNRVLRQFKRRELLRIAYGDLIGQQPIETVTEQLSFLADALCEAAVAFVNQTLHSKYGHPLRPDGQVAALAVLALGKLGGNELTYAGRLELLFLYDLDGKTNGRKRLTNAEYFDRVASNVVELLSGQDITTSARGRQTASDAKLSEADGLYDVDNSLRPGGADSPRALAFEAMRHHYDWMGRTWERQAFVKARAVAGDLPLGRSFLSELEPWVYRRYLSRADLDGIKALKRRIERRSKRVGIDQMDVESSRGGIRDVEFVIQFLQLINGGDLPSVRTPNTLQAIGQLHAANCLSDEEHEQLLCGYRFLRQLEHRIQIMNDTDAACIPRDTQQLGKLAIHMGYDASDQSSSVKAFQSDLSRHQKANRAILERLLKELFSDSTDPEPAAEFDLILDPAPPDELVDSILSRYGFQDAQRAYRNLLELSRERIRFLSTRRCRHALAAIAPELLRQLGKTTDPDAALTSLSRVSDSLGGKGVLWDLFRAHPPSLELYVRLCDASPYLSSILVGNPGMLDELMDSLMLGALPTRELLVEILDDWCRGAQDTSALLVGFKNVQHLNAGVRELLKKETIRRTTAFLSDVAEVCVQRVCDLQQEQLVRRYGQPWHQQADRPCELIVVALGKFGGREPNYHSDLDVLFLYETDGTTRDPRRGQATNRSTSHQHFFNELAQRITKTINQFGPQGRLYEMDTKLRPTGQLALPLTTFRQFYSTPPRPALSHWMQLCRARPIYGRPEAVQPVTQFIHSMLCRVKWQDDFGSQIRRLRSELERNASAQNLKRSPGGLVDVEFIAQTLQLKYAGDHPEILHPGTTEALERLRAAELIPQADARDLQQAYSWLRAIEARLRLMNTTARHDLPQNQRELEKLAGLIGEPSGAELAAHTRETMQHVRAIFQRLVPS